MGSSILSIGATALNAAQVGVATTGHNISNAATPGYSRQVVLQASAGSQNSGFAFVGKGTEVTGITVSKEQLALAQQHCRGWPVKLLLADYRSLQGRFDKVVSVGMFEHVGPKNHAAYFDTVRRLLEPQGLFLLHTIGIA